jgi:hypothetical protein
MNRTIRDLLFALAALTLAAGACRAEGPAAGEFAVRAPLTLAAGTALARTEVPSPALLRLQSSDARDLRIFNASGEAVPFAFMQPPGIVTPPREKTNSFAALPLYSAAGGARQPQGSTEVRIAEAGGRSVWVKMDGSDVAGVPRLDSVLFATRDEKRLLSGIELQATFPANTPIRFSVSSSEDLAQWSALPVRGRIYRFEGEGAPSNMTLDFDRPVLLEGRYLRLDWSGQPGVAVTLVTGLIAPPAHAAARVAGELPAAKPAGSGAIEITTGFATPIAALALTTSISNALLPVRILGRSEASAAWRQLGQTVVYRLGTPGSEAVNPPVPLHGASARWLRIESGAGADLSTAGLNASAEFQPLRVVFVASGAAPFELAAGRADTPPAALPLPTIAGTLEVGKKVDDLPMATVGTAVIGAPVEGGPLARFWPGGGGPGQTTVLWAVLLLGVLVLALVAWSLLRQLKAPPPQG